jgi:membrane protease subunit HflK
MTEQGTHDTDSKPAAGQASGSGSGSVEDTGSKALSDALHSSFTIVKVIMVFLVAVFLGSGLKVVGPQENAVILRFGRPVGTGDDALLGPGAHWAFPYPIDEIVPIPIGQIQTVASRVGWYATTAAMEAAGTPPPPGPSLAPGRDGYLLSGDENILHMRGMLRYRIKAPGLEFQFRFTSATNAVLDAFNNALIHTAASYRVDDILTRDVAGFRERVRARLDQLIGMNDLGIVVDNIELQAIPPRQLKEQFEAVGNAEIAGGTQINDANTYKSQTVSRARAEADSIRSGGETARNRLVETVAAEAKRFEDLRPAYTQHPDLFRLQLVSETVSRILTNAQEKFLLPASENGRSAEWRIHLDRKPRELNYLQPQPSHDAY